MKVEIELPDWILDNYIIEIGCDPSNETKYLNIIKERYFSADEIKSIRSELKKQFYLSSIFVRVEGVNRECLVLHFKETKVPYVEDLIESEG